MYNTIFVLLELYIYIYLITMACVFYKFKEKIQLFFLCHVVNSAYSLLKFR